MLHIANVISITVVKNMKEYHFGAVCALTKEELLRNRVPKHSKKKKINKMVLYVFISLSLSPFRSLKRLLFNNLKCESAGTV